MDPILRSVQDYIKSGEYFRDARKWYLEKYLHPFMHRSLMFVLASMLFVLFSGMIINILTMMPIVQTVRYVILTKDTSQTNAHIIHANQIKNDPRKSIADIMVRNYINKRESYNYDTLKSQLNFIQNTSTKIVLKDFYSGITIDNPNSPVMRYQKYIRRSIQVIDVNYPNKTEATIKFKSTAKDASGQIFEDMAWKANLSFEMDNVDENALANTKFNFIVTDYKVTLVQDNKNKSL